MLDPITRLFQRLTQSAVEPVWVGFELSVILLAVYWIVGKLEGARGTRPLRQLGVALLVVTLGVQILGSNRLEILYQFFVIGVAITALAAFQPELRRAFIRAGDLAMPRRRGSQARLIAALLKSAGYLSRNKFGALIAIQRTVDLRGWAENGTQINAEVSPNLLNALFFPNSPLHDLGIILRDNRVLAANCQFPSAESEDGDAGLGSRHLAAIGMSYESDALVLVVSEETGTISLADNGKLIRYLTLDDLEQELETRLGVEAPDARKRKAAARWAPWTRLRPRRLLVAAPLALIAWYLADQATLEDVDLRVELRPPPPTALSVAISAPRPARFNVRVRGAQRVVRDLAATSTGSLLSLTLSEDQLPPLLPDASGRQVVELRTRDLLATLTPFAESGVALSDIQPETVTLIIDELVTRPAQVELVAGSFSLVDVQIDPPEAVVTLPRTIDQQMPAGAALQANIEPQLADLPPGGPYDLGAVLLPLRMADEPLIDVQPREVRVVVRTADRIATRTRTFSNVLVHMEFSPLFWPTYLRSGRELYQVEELEWRLPNVEVRSDTRDLADLPTDAIHAFVEINRSLLNTAGDVPLNVQFRLPQGVTLDMPTPQVRVRVNGRGVGGG